MLCTKITNYRTTIGYDIPTSDEKTNMRYHTPNHHLSSNSIRYAP